VNSMPVCSALEVEFRPGGFTSYGLSKFLLDLTDGVGWPASVMRRRVGRRGRPGGIFLFAIWRRVKEGLERRLSDGLLDSPQPRNPR